LYTESAENLEFHCSSLCITPCSCDFWFPDEVHRDTANAQAAGWLSVHNSDCV